MRFLADMGLAREVVSWLCEQGHDAVHLREQGLHRLPDPDIFLKACAERRIILTFDLDFAEIAALSRRAEVSVIVFRLHNTRASNVIRRLSSVLAHSGSHLTPGTIITAEEMRHRIRQLPLPSAGPEA